MGKPRVVIVGGGPGGVTCAKALSSSADVTIIDSCASHLCQLFESGNLRSCSCCARAGGSLPDHQIPCVCCACFHCPKDCSRRTADTLLTNNWLAARMSGTVSQNHFLTKTLLDCHDLTVQERILRNNLGHSTGAGESGLSEAGCGFVTPVECCMSLTADVHVSALNIIIQQPDAQDFSCRSFTSTLQFLA